MQRSEASALEYAKWAEETAAAWAQYAQDVESQAATAAQLALADATAEKREMDGKLTLMQESLRTSCKLAERETVRIPPKPTLAACFAGCAALERRCCSLLPGCTKCQPSCPGPCTPGEMPGFWLAGILY